MERRKLEEEIAVKRVVLTQRHIENIGTRNIMADSLFDQLRHRMVVRGATNISAMNIAIDVEKFLRPFGGTSIEEKLIYAVNTTTLTGNDRELYDLLRELVNISSRIREMLYGQRRRLLLDCDNCDSHWIYDKESLSQYVMQGECEFVKCVNCQAELPTEKMKKFNK